MKTNQPNHHRTVLTEVQGWIPLIDHLVQRYDLITASVFGRVWRYSQMWSGVCHASLPRIAGDLNLARSTVRKAIIRLVADGYLQDMTPDHNHGRPHIYRDTGKVIIASKFTAEIQPDPPLRETEGSGNGAKTPLRETEGTLRETEGYPSGKTTRPLRQSATNHNSNESEIKNHNSPSRASDWWWTEAKTQLRQSMPKAAYDDYVDPLQLISEHNGLVVLQAPDDFHAQWVAGRLTSTLTRQLAGLLNRTVEIVITSPETQP